MSEDGSAQPSPGGGSERRRNIARIMTELGDVSTAFAVGAFNAGMTAPAIVAGAVAGFSYVGAMFLVARRVRP